MKTTFALTALALAGALTLGACGTTAPKPASAPTAPSAATSTATQSPTAAACTQLASGLASLPTSAGPARNAAIRQITASAAGTPLAGLVRRWRREVSTSPAAIARMSQAQATDMALNVENLVGEVNGTCNGAGVPGVMSTG